MPFRVGSRMAEPWTLAGRTFTSRLLLGTSRYPDPQTMLDAVEASGAEIVTVSIRRISLHNASGEGLLDILPPELTILPTEIQALGKTSSATPPTPQAEE